MAFVKTIEKEERNFRKQSPAGNSAETLHELYNILKNEFKFE